MPHSLWQKNSAFVGISPCSLGFPGDASGKEPACQYRRQKRRVRSLGREDPLEEGMETHFSSLSWRIPWTEEPVRLQSRGSQRVRHNWSDLAGIDSLLPAFLISLHLNSWDGDMEVIHPAALVRSILVRMPPSLGLSRSLSPPFTTCPLYQAPGHSKTHRLLSFFPAWIPGATTTPPGQMSTSSPASSPHALCSFSDWCQHHAPRLQAWA